MQPYRSTNNFSIGGLIKLLLLLGIGAIALGIVVGLVNKYIYLTLVFPLLMGAAAAAAMHRGVRWSKLRNPLLAAVIGVLTGTLVYTTYHYFRYQEIRARIRSDMLLRIATTLGEEEARFDDPRVLENSIDKQFAAATGWRGFPAYLVLQARNGETLGHIGGRSGVNLGKIGTWIYWLAELALVATLPAIYGWRRADEPFCEKHNRWYGPPQFVGRVPQDKSDEVLDLLDAGEFRAAGARLSSAEVLPALEIYIQECRFCRDEQAVLLAQDAFKQWGDVSRRTVERGLISAAQRAELMAAVGTSSGGATPVETEA